MARRRTVKAVVKELRAENPKRTVEVLYDPSGGWGGNSAADVLPESEWGEYQVNRVRDFGGLFVVEAS
jgi:hypothetical protein